MKRLQTQVCLLALLWSGGVLAQTTTPTIPPIQVPANPGAASADAGATTGWTLQQCIAYALAHNLTLQKNAQAERTSQVTLTEAKAARQPTVSGSIAQGLTYRPFQQTGGNFVNGGMATTAADKATQNGSYGINAQWTVWNGGQTRMQIADARLSCQAAAYDTQIQVQTLKEDLARLYVQLLYMNEAIRVNALLLAQDSLLCERGREMLNVGTMSRADLAQLEAQVSQGNYDLTNARMQMAEVRLQLTQLMNLPADTAEIHALQEATRTPGFTIVPLLLYINEKGLAKLQVALCKGKKEYDKRDSLKEKQDRREMDRAFKRSY